MKISTFPSSVKEYNAAMWIYKKCQQNIRWFSTADSFVDLKSPRNIEKKKREHISHLLEAPRFTCRNWQPRKRVWFAHINGY